MVGGRIGPYEITEIIGSGGMGEVYKARDVRLERVVAIKSIRSERRIDGGSASEIDLSAYGEPIGFVDQDQFLFGSGHRGTYSIWRTSMPSTAASTGAPLRITAGSGEFAGHLVVMGASLLNHIRATAACIAFGSIRKRACPPENQNG